MEISGRIKSLYENDTSEAFANLRELEALSDREDILYADLGEFLSMLDSEKYVIRVRGFRLLCKQARWDKDGQIDRAMGRILAAVEDEKPTAVRQALQYLEFVVPYKPGLCAAIREAALAIDCGRFRDTMRPLIEKDIRHLVALIDGAQSESS